MPTETYVIELDGRTNEQGYWLYVCRITNQDDTEFLYVGMTGDTGYKRGQSPFNRMTSHLNPKAKANHIFQRLQEHGIKPENCKTFKTVACGPIFVNNDESKEENEKSRAQVSAMEKALQDALQRVAEKNGKYTILSSVKSRGAYDPKLWENVRKAFSEHFPELEDLRSPSC